MNLHDLQTAVRGLSDEELEAFARWLEEHLALVWEQRIEADMAAGRLDEIGRRADADFDAGRCRPL